MAPALPAIFLDAGLPTPSKRSDLLIGAEEWMIEVLHSLRPQFAHFNLRDDFLGDFDTLSERLRAEVAASNSTTPVPTLVSYEQHSTGMPYLGVDVFWDGLRSDPRYADLVRRMGLPQVPLPTSP